jgi:NitT/TauT family transport system substrate-binding protein
MSNRSADRWTRREFLSTAALAGAGSILGLQSNSHAAEPPLETTRIRLGLVPSVCLAPQYVAETLLRAEGFTDVQYVSAGVGVPGAQRMGAGEIDISMNFAAPLVVAVDAGSAIVVLAGVHIGCFELIATERIRTIKDLKD